MDYDLKKDSKIYIAGHSGLIGSAFARFFEKNGYTNIFLKTGLALIYAQKLILLISFKELNQRLLF